MRTKRWVPARPSCQIQPEVLSGSLVVGGCDRSSERLLQAASRLGRSRQEVTAKPRLQRERRTPQEEQRFLPNWTLLSHGKFSLLPFVVGKLLLMVTVLPCLSYCALAEHLCCSWPFRTKKIYLTWFLNQWEARRRLGVFNLWRSYNPSLPFTTAVPCNCSNNGIASHQTEPAQLLSHDQSHDVSCSSGNQPKPLSFSF